MRRWIVLAVVGLVVSGPALAGKKGKKSKKEGDVDPAPVAQEAAEPAAEQGAATTTDASEMPKLELPCSYAPGATQRYSLVKQTIRTMAGGEQQPLGASSSELTLTVSDFADSQAVVELRYDKAELSSQSEDPVSQQITEALTKVLVGQPVRVSIDHRDGTISVANIDDVSAMFKKAMSDTIAILENQGEALPAEAVSMLEEMVGDAAIIEASVLEDLRPLFDYTCGPYPVGTLDYQVSLENPLGGGPMPGIGAVTLHPVEEGQARFEANESLDEAQVEQLLKPMLPPDVQVDTSSFGVMSSRTLSVTVDAEAGWVKSWRNERIVGAMGVSHTETAEMTLIPSVGEAERAPSSP